MTIDNPLEGLASKLVEGGPGLSGGQQQCLTIARAVLTRPDALLLNEATSNPGSASVTAPRYTPTAIGADRILVIEDGRLRASGTHADPMDTDVTYRRLASHRLTSAGAAR
ncbi:ATP-binding cassette domain-containing protein [Streptomyces sp. NRRL S-920]|uniref:ATP-binding cassette domain-containing protein n=1 Tax=Streptomyces sp. NRRL S-920 TaxID=1463921 RepID=UPI0004CB26D6|nr:ATP-binding cassette domain-containing protein [Streptomyces sp. NRRL S-920]